MDPRTFDRLVIAASTRPSRRALVRLLGAGALGALAARWAVPASAQRSDRDGDGLFDDDETDVYGTNPDVYDTDGDGSGDGEEVYYGTDPLVNANPAPAPAPAPAAEPAAEPCPTNMLRCNGVCVYPYSDSYNCGACNRVCGTIFCTYRPEGICYTYCNAGACTPYYTE